MKYSLNSRILHWLMALIIISLLAVGIYMTNFLSKESEYRMDFYNLHKSFGVLVIFLFTLRIVNRIANKPPTLPESMSKFEKFSAHFAHILLYILMIFVPIAGYLMSNSYGYPVKLFGLEMPFLVQKNFDLAGLYGKLHMYAAYLLIGTIVVHVAGALKHRFFDKPEHDVLKRML